MARLLNRKKKLTKLQVANRKGILDDTKQPMAKRIKAHKEIREEMMNPKEEVDFNPDTFDPMEGVKNHSLIKRERKPMPHRLPNPHGLKPKEILEGQMIGMFESKQDLYLMLCAAVERIADLEDRLDILEGG
jgi:hypothetical protein